MKNPPNTKLVAATFKTKIMTNRSKKSAQPEGNYVEAPEYVIEELVDVSTNVLENNSPKIIDGEYTNDQE